MRAKMLIGVAGATLMLSFTSAAVAQSNNAGSDTHTSAQLTPGQTVNGEISTANEHDMYRLHVETGQSYHMTLDGVAAAGQETPALDPMLTVFAPDGTTQLAFDDDFNGSLNSALTFVPSQTGDVFVEARGFNEDATGPYQLSVTQAALPPDAVGNDHTTHASLRPSTQTNGSIDYDGDVDVYRMNVSRGNVYHLSLSSAEGDGGLHDPTLRIVDRQGHELASNDDGPDGLNSALDFIPEHGGDVYVEAHSFSDTGTGNYVLAMKSDRLPPDPAGGDIHTSRSLSVGHPIEAGIDYANDHDWYRARLVAGRSYRFTLNGSGEHAIDDPLLRIHDAQGQEIASDDDGGEGFNSYLEFTAPTTGTYYVEAQALNETATGGYTLGSAEGDIPNSASTDATLDAGGDNRTGTLSPGGDSDWYKLALTQGQSFRVAVDGGDSGGALPDPLVILHGPDGAELARDDDGGPGLNSLLEYQATAAGNYYVEVRGFADDAAGTYTVTLTPGEIGNSTDTADQLTVGDEGRASMIGENGDADWFQVQLIEGRPYRFNVTSGDADPLADPALTLYDANGKQIAQDDDGGAGNNAYLAYTSVEGGTYYAAVSSFGDTGTGHYSINVNDTEVPGNTGTDEQLDPTRDDRTNSIEIAGDLDDYSVQLEAGVSYVIEVRGVGHHALGDPSLSVLNGEGTRVAGDDDSGPGRNARLRFRPHEAGAFYLQASGKRGTTGDYRISIVRQ